MTPALHYPLLAPHNARGVPPSTARGTNSAGHSEHDKADRETRGTTAQARMGNLETSDTFADSFTRPDETDDAFARPQCRKIKHFARAKVPTVSPTHKDRAAKVTAVSAQQRVAPNRQAMRHWYGGRQRDLPRCRWAAGPGRTSRRRTQPRTATQVPPVWRAPEGPEGTGGLRDRPLRAKLACGDLAGGRARRRPEHQRPGEPALTLRRRARGVPCS